MTPLGPDRGISPVVGTVLLVAIVALLVGLSAVVFFGAAEEQQPAPEIRLDLEPAETGGDYVLSITAGETLDGDNVRLIGVEDPDVLAGMELTAGDEVVVTPTADTVRIVWEAERGEEATYTLETFAVDPSSGGGAGSGGTFDADVFTGNSNDIVGVDPDTGTVSTILASGTITAIGSPAGDVTGDGSADVPYVTNGEVVGVVGPDGSTTTVADSGDIGGSIETDKTRVAVGAWDGSPTSVFFVDQNHDTIYRATPSGGVTTVATPSDGDGAQAVGGPADVDGDGTDELVYADASQTVKYLEPSGSVVDTTLSLGSSTGIGTGAVGSLDGYSDAVVTAVDGGNNVVVLEGTTADTISGSDTASGTAPQAAKSPTTIADVDGDGSNELVYVGADDQKLKYLDGIGGTPTIEFLRDEDGNKIDGAVGTGAA